MKTEEKSVNNKKLIPFWVIERALEGDIQAINKILKHVETICLLFFSLEGGGAIGLNELETELQAINDKL